MTLFLFTQTFHCYLFKTCFYLNPQLLNSDHAQLTELKSPVLESLTFHWDHGRQYLMYVTADVTLPVFRCLSCAVTLYLSVHVLSPPQTDFACFPAVLLNVTNNTLL